MKRVSLILISIIFVLASLGIVPIGAQAGILDFFYKNKDVLDVEGNKVFLNGDDIKLRGVAVGDPHSRQTNDKRSIDDYRIIKDEWNANVVRLSVHPGSWKKDEKQVRKYLEEEVESARDNGLFVIIDWHVIGRPNGWYKQTKWGDEHYYSYSSNFNTAKDFWKYVALEFRGDRGVLFELWNEPADIDDDFRWNKIKDYMQRLNDIIRSQGAKNIIISPGTWWTYNLRGIKDDALKGNNIGYAWHNYPSNKDRYLGWDKALDGLQSKYPIFITEWGFSSDQGSNYFTSLENFPYPFRDYIEENNLHFTAWCWHDSWEPAMLKNNWKDLTVFGEFVKNFLINDEIKNKYLDNLKKDNNISSNMEEAVYNFIKYGTDENTKKLGEGERASVVYSFKAAFNKLPEDENDIEDIKKIASGHWPSNRSEEAEKNATNYFSKVYKRWPSIYNKYDQSAIMIMAYGLKQRAENRNLDSERAGIIIYKNIFGNVPSLTEEWNVMQAITYSGAKR